MITIEEFLQGHVEQQIELARRDLEAAQRAVQLYSVQVAAWEDAARLLGVKLRATTQEQRR